MENYENNQPEDKPINDENEIKTYLLETSKWGKFLAIVGYVGIAILAILALCVVIGFTTRGIRTNEDSRMRFFGILYLVIAFVYYFPVNFLYKFAIQMREGLESDNKQSVTSGFQNLKSLFRFIGIVTIVILSIYAFLLIIVLPLSLLVAK
ncbi:MAG TPA: hypothetical protein PKH58_11610 [Paludibacteraceae bacterium]|nr:hypothetical protein [Paludibacteraceae bacterium]